MPFEETKNTRKKISSRDIIHAEIDEEITSISDRIRRVNGREVYLVIPQKAVLFHSIVNLRILHQIGRDFKKIIYVVTADRHGRQLAEDAELPIVEKLEGESYTPRDLSPNIAVNALRNSREEKLELKPGRKISIAEIIESGHRKDKTPHNLREDLKKSQKFILRKSEELSIATPNRKMFLGFLALAILIFCGVIYIALPSATVMITPTASVIEKTVNLIFTNVTINQADTAASERAVPTYSVETTFERTFKYSATEKVFTGTSAKGEITIYNETAQSWHLVSNTRFQTEDGVVFRVKAPVNVPGAKRVKEEMVPGKLTVAVVADDTDATDDVIGERGNIVTGTTLFAPGLSKYNQKLLYAVANEDFTGGTTDYYTIVSENDIAAAKDFTVIALQNDAKTELEKYIAERNKTINRDLRLFDNSQTLKTEVLEMKVPEDLIGQEVEEFQVSAKVKVSGLAYDYSRMLAILERELQNAVHPDKELASVDADGIALKVSNDTLSVGSSKMTVVGTIQGVEQWNLNPKTEAGADLINQIRNQIVGESVLDAKNYIRNLEEVRNVEIKVWPFWSLDMPDVASSINFQIVNN